MNIAVCWPRPRRDRWTLGRVRPDQYPDQSDGLLALEESGEFRVHIEDSLGPPLNPLARMHEFFSGLDPLRAARALLRRPRYDAIIAVGCSTALYLVRLRRVLGLRIPIILIDPALSRDYPRRKRLQDRVLPRVEKVVVFGTVQLEYLREEYGDRVDAIFLHHRFDTEFFTHEAAEERTEGAAPLVLSVGNDVSRDFETLVRAMAHGDLAVATGARCTLRTDRPLELGPWTKVCREPLTFVELRRLYAQADVFVLPLQDTIHAGGINSLLEAMSMARPLVVTRSRGILDYVEPGETALVVKPGDSAGMAAGIRHLLENPVEARRLGENARRWVLDHCRTPAYAARVGALLHEVIERSSAPLPKTVLST